jgi:5'-nucleotidase
MNILVTNDDGVDNPGIWGLVRAIKDLANVTVVAPANNQSGRGAGLSFRNSIAFTETDSPVQGVPCYAVEGTPGDATVVGLKHVLNDQVDAVVSGINPGHNTSRNMFISGTMGAAIIASSNGVKAAAFSAELLEDVDDPLIGKITNAITKELVSEETPQATLFNVNFPSIHNGKINGAEESAPTPSLLQMKLERHENGGYEIFSRLAVGSDGSTAGQGTDIEVLMRGRVSITAVNGYDLKHIPNDPSLQRMIDAANLAIG